MELPRLEKPKEKKEETTRQIKSKRSYSKQREIEQIEAKIEKLEQEVKQLTQLLEQSEISENPHKLSEVCNAVGLAENQIEQLYIKWEELQQN